MRNLHPPPGENEAEVTLIGGTAGFGETIIIHLGNGIWAVVDSCTNPVNGECVALSYFDDIEVKVKEQLRYVVCVPTGMKTILWVFQSF